MKSKDIYDIIIEKITKDWNDSMNKQIKNNSWETPRYSKNQINKAGEVIANPSSSKEDRDNALVILNNWRASHAYPLQVVCNNLRTRNPDAIVVQRLKRLDSITNKIKRFPHMNLYRMQDLGGCRVIVDNISQVYKTVDNYKNSRIRHKLKKEKDYIQDPKESGYRSYHMVYQFHSDKKETYNQNILIEIQFRTKLQHIWATAVEMMGIYTRSNLKASQGNEDILRFFTLVSSLFAIKEKMPVCPNTNDKIDELIKEVKDLDDKYRIILTLNAIKVSIDYTSNEKSTTKSTYYILILDYSKKKISIKSFDSSKIEIATQAYAEIENECDQDVVLVSADSFTSLKEAYPNYFVDISKFSKMIRAIIKKHTKK